MTLYKFKKHVICYLGFVLLIGYLASCTSMNDSYDQFLRGGEHIYPAKADCLSFMSGVNRAKLSWLIKDNSVSKSKIYWRNGTDSMAVSISQSTSPVDTAHAVVKNLIGGNYTFKVVNFDDKGHESVPTFVVGRVYGKNMSIHLPTDFY